MTNVLERFRSPYRERYSGSIVPPSHRWGSLADTGEHYRMAERPAYPTGRPSLPVL